MCSQIKEYEITFVKWSVSGRHKPFLLAAIVVAGCAFTFLLAGLLFKFIRFFRERRLLSAAVTNLQNLGFKLPE
jgi:hypothetical protein